MRHKRVVCYAGAVLAVFLMVGPAAAAETTGETKAEAKPEMTPEQHHAKGEVLYNKKWVHIETLFKDYRQGRHELAYAEKRGDRAKDELAGLHREMALMKSETRETERPVRMELGKARNELRKYNHMLRKNPPVKPTLRDLPRQPRRPAGYSSRRNSSNYGSSSSSRSSNSDRYDDQMREWRRTCEAIKSDNEAKIKKYQAESKIYKQEQAEAKAAVPKLEATIKESLAKLDEIDTGLKEKQAPTRNKSDGVTEGVLAHNRKVGVVRTRVAQMAAALRAAPQSLRAKHGIIEFEKVFYASSELKMTYEKTQGEINRVRDQLKAESEKAGIPFPEEWRHPQQDRMDAIKALVEKAAGAAKT